MAKKTQTVFVCQECGYESPKWMGQCICGAWNTMIEERITSEAEKDSRSRSFGGTKGNAREKVTRPLSLTQIKSGSSNRIDTGIGELNRVLGGGMVKGSLTLISGEPGIGKSTIIIQAASNISKAVGKVLYVSGEESEEQIKIRADRVCNRVRKGKEHSNSFINPMGESYREEVEENQNLFILSETNMENIMDVIEELKPEFIIIDSIQTMYTASLDSSPGSVSQVRTCGNELMKLGKVRNIPIFIVAHVTKSGDLAGPKIVEHLVDCVLNFQGERNQELRILRSFKNRFGTTSEIGAFEMAEEGLLEIENLSNSFLEGLEGNEEGAVATAVYEGSRPLFLEIQGLTSPANIGFARRSTIGIEASRLNMILAVLERKAGISLMNQDVYVNVVGGIKPEGTSTDLAVALAIYSSFKRQAGSGRILAVGEIGLTGDLRSVPNCDKIVKEASRLGFDKIIMPKKNAENIKFEVKGLKIAGVANIREAINQYVNL